jgi:hypothetical protein
VVPQYSMISMYERNQLINPLFFTIIMQEIIWSGSLEWSTTKLNDVVTIVQALLKLFERQRKKTFTSIVHRCFTSLTGSQQHLISGIIRAP